MHVHGSNLEIKTCIHVIIMNLCLVRALKKHQIKTNTQKVHKKDVIIIIDLIMEGQLNNLSKRFKIFILALGGLSFPA